MTLPGRLPDCVHIVDRDSEFPTVVSHYCNNLLAHLGVGLFADIGGPGAIPLPSYAVWYGLQCQGSSLERDLPLFCCSHGTCPIRQVTD